MPKVDHNNAPEVPWRPSYRKWLITQEGDGTTSTDASISEVGVGTGAPLHTHEDDELIVVLSGTLSVRYGDETHEVGADHTIVVPPNVPHGFHRDRGRPSHHHRNVPRQKTRSCGPGSWRVGRRRCIGRGQFSFIYVRDLRRSA